MRAWGGERGGGRVHWDGSSSVLGWSFRGAAKQKKQYLFISTQLFFQKNLGFACLVWWLSQSSSCFSTCPSPLTIGLEKTPYFDPRAGASITRLFHSCWFHMVCQNIDAHLRCKKSIAKANLLPLHRDIDGRREDADAGRNEEPHSRVHTSRDHSYVCPTPPRPLQPPQQSPAYALNRPG